MWWHFTHTMLSARSRLLCKIYCRISFYKVLRKVSWTVTITDSHSVVEGLKESKKKKKKALPRKTSGIALLSGDGVWRPGCWAGWQLYRCLFAGNSFSSTGMFHVLITTIIGGVVLQQPLLSSGDKILIIRITRANWYFDSSGIAIQGYSSLKVLSVQAKVHLFYKQQRAWEAMASGDLAR